MATFNPLTTDPASVSQAGTGLSSTDLADINEGMAYLTLINPDFLEKIFFQHLQQIILQADSALDKLYHTTDLTASDKASFAIIKSKFQKVAGLSPAAELLLLRLSKV